MLVNPWFILTFKLFITFEEFLGIKAFADKES